MINDAQSIAKLKIRLSKYITLISPLIDLLAALAVVGVVTIGGLAVINGWMGLTAGTLITFVIGLALIFSPASRLSGFNASMITTLVALQLLHQLDQKRPKIMDSDEAIVDFNAHGDIELRNICFHYPGSKKRLLFEGLNMRFRGGETSAIVGQTGSGKTTILSLIARLYEPVDGTVFIGGQDIKNIKIDALRSVFSVVTQDIFLFDATVEENVRFVFPDATDVQVAGALEKAQLSDLVVDKGGKTIGPRGDQLSGGQKQRVAIARAFLRDAPIVLLDEATSALDQHTEEKVNQALRALCVGKTTLIIAHRLATITHADQIFLLEQGSVTECGTHEELLKRSGLYAALFHAQQGQKNATRSKGRHKSPGSFDVQSVELT